MPVDPASVAPEARAQAIKIGEDFGSDDVLAQLDVSILNADKHAASLSSFGWPATQTQKLRDLRAMIRAALVQRAAAKAAKKVTNAALRQAVSEGKIARSAARGALNTARNELFEKGKLELVNRIDALLAVTASSGAKPTPLAEQLGNLGELLTHPEVVSILGDSAASIQNRVSTALTGLEVAIESKDRPHGTPPETEDVNLLDGLAVIALRALRKVARTAARAEGRPEIAAAFELNHLYRTVPRPTGE
ncbi:MAG TPA: hypothetical protein VIL20_10725 [Sandaracinaceae bacterium]